MNDRIPLLVQRRYERRLLGDESPYRDRRLNYEGIGYILRRLDTTGSFEPSLALYKFN